MCHLPSCSTSRRQSAFAPLDPGVGRCCAPRGNGLQISRAFLLQSVTFLLQSFKFVVDGPVPKAQEYATLFDIGVKQLRLAEAALLQALDWRIRSPTACDFLNVFVERERCAGVLPAYMLHQLQQVIDSLPSARGTLFFPHRHPFSVAWLTPSFSLQHAEQYGIKFLHSPDSNRFLPSEIAAAAWRESLLLWNVQGGCSADISSALAARSSFRAPALAAAMAAVKVHYFVK
jgi:hypothetical protein